MPSSIIIPLADERSQVPRAGEPVDLEVRYRGSAEARSSLYDDDGTTFAYERGECSWTMLAVRPDAGRLQGSVVRPSQGKPFTYRNVRWRMMTSE